MSIKHEDICISHNLTIGTYFIAEILHYSDGRGIKKTYRDQQTYRDQTTYRDQEKTYRDQKEKQRARKERKEERKERTRERERT